MNSGISTQYSVPSIQSPEPGSILPVGALSDAGAVICGSVASLVPHAQVLALGTRCWVPGTDSVLYFPPQLRGGVPHASSRCRSRRFLSGPARRPWTGFRPVAIVVYRSGGKAFVVCHRSQGCGALLRRLWNARGPGGDRV